MSELLMMKFQNPYKMKYSQEQKSLSKKIKDAMTAAVISTLVRDRN